MAKFDLAEVLDTAPYNPTFGKETVVTKGKAPRKPRRTVKAEGGYPTDVTAISTTLGTDYVLAWMDAGKVVAALPLPFHPSTFEVSQEYATNLERTFGAIPKREHAPPQEWNIVLSGRIGTQPRHWYSLGGLKEDFPINIIINFRRFLDEYQKGAATAGAIALSNEQYAFQNLLRNYLVLYAFWENRVYYCDVAKFVESRTAVDSRNSEVWTLQLHAWADATTIQPMRTKWTFPREDLGSQRVRVSVGDAPEDVVSAGALQNAANDVATMQGSELTSGQLAKVAAAVKQANAAGSPADTCLQSLNSASPSWLGPPLQLAATLQRTLNGAQGVLSTAARTRGQLSAVAGQYLNLFTQLQAQAALVRDLTQLPRQLVGQTLSALVKLADVFNTLAAAHDEASRPVVHLIDMAGRALIRLLGEQGGRLVAAGTTGYGVVAAPLTATTDTDVYTLPAGCYSWKDVSVALYGDASGVGPLMDVNSAQSFFTDSDGTPLLPGVKVLVPAAGGAVKATPGQSPTEYDVMGVDFLVGADGDWVLEGAASVQPSGGSWALADEQGSDVQVVRGYDNLRQGLVTRLSTETGSIAADPGFGALALRIGQTAPNDQELAAATVQMRQSVLSDGRVADVSNTRAVFDGDEFFMEFDVKPIGATGDNIPVLAPVLPA